MNAKDMVDPALARVYAVTMRAVVDDRNKYVCRSPEEVRIVLADKGVCLRLVQGRVAVMIAVIFGGSRRANFSEEGSRSELGTRSQPSLRLVISYREVIEGWTARYRCGFELEIVTRNCGLNVVYFGRRLSRRQNSRLVGADLIAGIDFWSEISFEILMQHPLLLGVPEQVLEPTWFFQSS